jgi:curved DNA-binding protein CbpA
MKDYYRILNISPKSKQDKIRSQYRLLVVECHPDKFTDPQAKARAEERIKEINEAYETLSDPDKRARYDHNRTPKPTPPEKRDEQPARRPREATFEEHLHYRFRGAYGDIVEIRLNRPANVILLDPINYNRYQAGASFRYRGGYTDFSLAELQVPFSGTWHLVIDLGGMAGHLQAAARLVRRSWW